MHPYWAIIKKYYPSTSLGAERDGLWQNIKKNDPFWWKKIGGDAKVAFDDAKIFFYFIFSEITINNLAAQVF